MKAAVFTQFRAPLTISDVPTRSPDDGVVLAVDATGICRSDWQRAGHDGHQAPHVRTRTGRTIVEVGKDIRNWNTATE